MSWLVLVISGLFEAVWATALDRSAGMTKLWPTVTFFAGLAVSMGGLAWALKSLPVGTAYAVWVGIGAVATLGYSFLTGAETMTAVKLLFVAMIVGGIIGLKVTG